jgi:hypothetical protein
MDASSVGSREAVSAALVAAVATDPDHGKLVAACEEVELEVSPAAASPPSLVFARSTDSTFVWWPFEMVPVVPV